MNVKITCLGWNRAPANLAMYCPYGYRTYLCVAENGIICRQHIAVTDKNDEQIKDGIYELSDSDWSYDNPRWEELAEKDCEEIEIA